ncbi:hypothetical protein FSP39_014055 [Pinctada imbricata]|uniref:HAT C-terminal dimerisation domain-containing protein n=1 Tax=Pinctada imbricata TaxID=66713 RepID=A0AA89CE07_PINIB|nr:hypothetical protein FSP39_014055 [Pinctada imbricata]
MQNVSKLSRNYDDFVWHCELDEMKGINLGSTYRNREFAKCFIESIARTEFEKVASIINNAKFVCVIGDGSTDASVQEQEICLNNSMLRRSFDALKQKGDKLLIPTRADGTRWIGHQLLAVTNIISSYKFIIQHMEQLKETSDRVSSDSKNKAIGFLKLLKSKDVMSFLLFLVDALTPLRQLSLTLQEQDGRLAVIYDEFKCALESMEKLKSSDLKESNVPEWSDVHRRMSTRYSHILSLMDLILTMAPSSAQAERGFSQLKLVKTNIRANLGQSSLNNALGIKFLSKDINEYDPTDAVKHWNDSALFQRRPNARTRAKTRDTQTSEAECQLDNVEVQPGDIENSEENEIVESEGSESKSRESEEEPESESDMSDDEERVFKCLREIEVEIEREYL